MWEFKEVILEIFPILLGFLIWLNEKKWKPLHQQAHSLDTALGHHHNTAAHLQPQGLGPSMGARKL